MSFIAWIIVGGIAGWLASLFTATDSQMGCAANIVVGMIGSLVGGTLVVLLSGGGLDFNTAFTQFNLTSILVSTVGAIVFIFLLKMFRGGKV